MSFRRKGRLVSKTVQMEIFRRKGRLVSKRCRGRASEEKVDWYQNSAEGDLQKKR